MEEKCDLPLTGGREMWRWRCFHKHVGEAAGVQSWAPQGPVQASMQVRSPDLSPLLPDWLVALSYHLKEGNHSSLPLPGSSAAVEDPGWGPWKSKPQETGGWVRLSKLPGGPHTPMFPVSPGTNREAACGLCHHPAVCCSNIAGASPGCRAWALWARVSGDMLGAPRGPEG